LKSSPTSSSNQIFYNRIAPFYRLIDCFLRKHKSHLITELNASPSGDLLCMGVGFGKELKALQKHRIVGIDHSEKMLAKAKKYNPNIELVCMKAEQTSFENESFDYIIMAHLLATDNQSEKIITEAKRLLKKDGKLFILNHFTPNNFLRYFDILFSPFSSLFHFQSVFYLASLPLKNTFKIDSNQPIGAWNYYRLLTLSKQND
tara:strand:- start:4730 stop:5338 length:609 start_codon:yes stop_codon:yes gene_type:complete